jgi:hypothetical protein
MIKTILILIVSVGIGFALTFTIAASISSIGNSSLPFMLWGVFTVIIAIGLRRVSSQGKVGRRGEWGSPEQTRDRIVSTPQFTGRFDREKGLLETTVRMTVPDRASHQGWWMGQPEDITIYRFRGELLKQDGSPLDYIPVEIRGRTNKWVGVIADGDRLRIEGEIKDGVLHAKNAFNFSTNSWVGEK